MTQEELKLVLEALELCNGAETVEGVVIYTDKAITAIKEALAQPGQEPVCPECKAGVLYECMACSSNNYPPQRTEQEPLFKKIIDQHPGLAEELKALDGQEPVAHPERHELQAKGEHPAPCARHCEANAFQIVIKNLKAQLAQPEQEPVAWITPDGEGFRIRFSPPTNDVLLGWDALYTIPPQRTWVGLTDEQVRKCFFLGDAPPSSPPHWWEYRNSDYLKIYAFIEAELKEQNT